MKKLIIMVWGLIILFMGNHEILALTVSEDNLTMGAGSEKNISLYANTEEEVISVSFDLFFTTYDIPAYFYVDSSFTDSQPDGPNHKITLNEAKSGQILLGNVTVKSKSNPQDLIGTVNIQNAKATKKDGSVIRLNTENINVKIGQETSKKEPTIKETNLLKSIESEKVKIKLEENVFEYDITINKDLAELDLKPIPKKDNYKVEISSQKISDLQDNKITIKVSGDNNEEEYVIKVNKLTDIEDVEIDNTNFKENNSYKSSWIVMIVILSIGLIVGLIVVKKK